MRRRLLPPFRWLHRWVGLVFALPILLEGATGSFLVAARTIEQWQAPVLSVPATEVNVASVVAVAQRLATGPLVASHYVAAQGLRPAVVDLTEPGMRSAALRLWIDPTGPAVLGSETSPDWLTGKAHRLHETMFLPFGRQIVGWCGVAMVLMSVTGVLLWWPSRGRFLAGLGVSRRARGARLARELHGAVAVWLLLPLLFEALSGVPLGFPASTRAMAGLPPMQVIGGRAGPPPGGKVHADVAAIVTRAQTAFPGARLAELWLPNVPGRAAFARLRRPEDIDGAPRLFVVVSPDGERVLAAEDPAGNRAGWLIGWGRTLHGTDAGGLAWRWVQFLSGAAMPLLAITGAILWAIRRGRRVRHQRESRREAQAAG